MMQAYEKYIGKIQSNIFFIVTENIQKLDHYGGYSLVTCTDIPCDVDFIVLSSLPFQQDMYNQLVKEGISPKKIQNNSPHRSASLSTKALILTFSFKHPANFFAFAPAAQNITFLSIPIPLIEFRVILLILSNHKTHYLYTIQLSL